MSDHPFRWVPSLQHISAVKIIEIVWKRIEDREELEDYVQLELSETSSQVKHKTRRAVQASISDHLETLVENLPLPNPLKLSLKTFVQSMVQEAMNTLGRPLFKAILKAIDDAPEAIRHFTNFQYNNEGLIDSKIMLQSYLKPKEVINADLWNLLCLYCIEEEIVRLGMKIDWAECTESFKSFEQVYWYHKIYGTFPSEKMFRSHFFPTFQEDLDNGVYSDTNIAENLLAKTTSCFEYLGQPESISTINYCRNLNIDDEIFIRNIKKVANSNVILAYGFTDLQYTVYCLRTVEKEDCMSVLSRFGTFFLLRLQLLPWCRFIGTWISAVETIDAYYFASSFEHVCGERNAVAYASFAEIWRVFYRRFKMAPEKLRSGFAVVFFGQDVRLCCIMFEGMERAHREFLIGAVGHQDYREKDKFVVGPQFYRDFSEEVLIDDEERELFRKSVRVAPGFSEE